MITSMGLRSDDHQPQLLPQGGKERATHVIGCPCDRDIKGARHASLVLRRLARQR